jgi:hypothetical protein
MSAPCSPIEKAITRILERAASDEKPNFTQYQLALSEISSPPLVSDAFATLRHLMEQKFKLTSLDALMAPSPEASQASEVSKLP